MRDVIFNKKMIFNRDVEAIKLELKKAETTQNISLNKLAELLQQLDEIKISKLAKPDMFIFNNDDDIITIIMPGVDNTNLDN